MYRYVIVSVKPVILHLYVLYDRKQALQALTTLILDKY